MGSVDGPRTIRLLLFTEDKALPGERKFTNNLQEIQGYGSSELVESLQRKFGTKVLDIPSLKQILMDITENMMKHALSNRSLRCLEEMVEGDA